MKQSTTSAPIEAATPYQFSPEFVNFTGLRHGWGISRTRAYELERSGDLKFVRLRSPGNRLGRVPVSVESARAYLGRCASQSK